MTKFREYIDRLVKVDSSLTEIFLSEETLTGNNLIQLSKNLSSAKNVISLVLKNHTINNVNI